MYRISTYIPETHLEAVKEAMFAAGAGRIGQYDSCAWQVLGTGQFRPLEGSSPFIGEEMVIETVPEYKVELVCDKQIIREVIETLILTHPYEEPAYEIYEFKTLEDLGE
ncbi:MAG: NGG1p interacting factor NIF3 [Gammaproteobacteria bacterium]|nr:NGG1p interacting factor NIF3 [Gammaproteobacteria bacterium]